MSNYPAGTTYLPGEHPDEVAYEKALDDWEGYTAYLRPLVIQQLMTGLNCDLPEDMAMRLAKACADHRELDHLAEAIDVWPLMPIEEWAAQQIERYGDDR